MLILVLPESNLLHYFSVERAVDAEFVVDSDQPAQRFELQLTNVARAVTAQLPIINQGKVCRRHHAECLIINHKEAQKAQKQQAVF